MGGYPAFYRFYCFWGGIFFLVIFRPRLAVENVLNEQDSEDGIVMEENSKRNE